MRRQKGRSSAKALTELQTELHSQSGAGRSLRREIEQEFGRRDAAGKLVKCFGRAVFDSRETAQACRERLHAITTRKINIVDGCTRTEGDTHAHLHITNTDRV